MNHWVRNRELWKDNNDNLLIMDGFTYSSHFALSFSSGILFKNIFIRVTKLPVFKLWPTEKQLFHRHNNNEYSIIIITCKFVPKIWVKPHYISQRAEMMPNYTSFFLQKSSPCCLLVPYMYGSTKHFEQKSRTSPLIPRRCKAKDTTYAAACILSGFFFCNFICCVFFALISSFHGYNNLYQIHIFINFIYLYFSQVYYKPI